MLSRGDIDLETLARQVAEAQRYLFAAQGSDWFWWYGSDQESGDDGYFDAAYRELLGRARRVARALVERGLARGARAALVLPTGPELYDAFFGVLLAGGVPVPLYPPVRLGRLDRLEHPLAHGRGRDAALAPQPDPPDRVGQGTRELGDQLALALEEHPAAAPVATELAAPAPDPTMRRSSITSPLERIADEAEVSVGTVYFYFKNKEELYASLSLRILQYLHIRVTHVNKETQLSAEKKLQALMEAMYDVYDFDPLIIINMFHLQSSETLRNLSPDLLHQIETLSRNSLNAIAKIFEEGIRKKIFMDRHPTAFRWTACETY